MTTPGEAGRLTANWLPTPEGECRTILRLCQPNRSVFAGQFEIPLITTEP